MERKHHLEPPCVRPSSVSAPDSVEMALRRFLGRQTEALASTGWGLIELASLAFESRNPVEEWTGEISLLVTNSS